MRHYGYRYVLQTDDDTFVMEKFPMNIVTLMKSSNFGMAAREIKEDDSSVMWGLAELAKYFLTTEQVTPTTMFNHCSPNDITGMFSR